MWNVPPKSRAELLETRICELVDCWVGVCCTDGCNRTSYLPLKLMAARQGGRTTLRGMLERLRCQLCRTPPSSSWVVDYPIESGDHGGQTATWRVDINLRLGARMPRSIGRVEHLPLSSIGRESKCPRCLRVGVIDDIENGAVIIRARLRLVACDRCGRGEADFVAAICPLARQGHVRSAHPGVPRCWQIPRGFARRCSGRRIRADA
jgi:hypothetical protein